MNETDLPPSWLPGSAQWWKDRAAEETRRTLFRISVGELRAWGLWDIYCRVSCPDAPGVFFGLVSPQDTVLLSPRELARILGEEE